MRALCNAAPAFARFLLEEIPKHLGEDNSDTSRLSRKSSVTSDRPKAEGRELTQAEHETPMITREETHPLKRKSSRYSNRRRKAARTKRYKPVTQAERDTPTTPEPVDTDDPEPPPTEEVPRTAPIVPGPEPEPETLEDLMSAGIATVFKMSQRTVPKGTHSAILRMLQSSKPAPHTIPNHIWGTEPRQWSRSMWRDALFEGISASKTVTVLNMIKWMGLAAYYDFEIQRLRANPPKTKRGKQATRVETFVLDDIRHSVFGPAIIPEKADDDIRKDITRQFHKGRKLQKIVDKTNLGILLLGNVWYDTL